MNAGGEGLSPRPGRISERPWVVWRQDDHGNRAVVSRHDSRDEAERVVADFTARGHKQLYWVVEDRRDAPTNAD
jgi:hypothetical protein